jgi:hypothetical protein
MVACIRFGIGPDLGEDLIEHSAFSLACLLLWPLIVLIGIVLAVIFMGRHIFGRLSVGLVKLVSREETT